MFELEKNVWVMMFQFSEFYILHLYQSCNFYGSTLLHVFILLWGYSFINTDVLSYCINDSSFTFSLKFVFLFCLYILTLYYWVYAYLKLLCRLSWLLCASEMSSLTLIDVRLQVNGQESILGTFLVQKGAFTQVS